MHEEILSTLAGRAPDLEVISRTTMMLYRATPKPVTQIAKELGVTHVLEGTVRREGNKVRVTLLLVDARNDARCRRKFRSRAGGCNDAADGSCDPGGRLAGGEAGGESARPAPPDNPKPMTCGCRQSRLAKRRQRFPE